jgi:hypothetical protein
MAAVRYFVPITQALEAPSLQETFAARYHRDTDVDVGETPPMKTGEKPSSPASADAAEWGDVCSIFRDTTLGRFAADLGDLSNPELTGAHLGEDGRARIHCQADSNRREESSTINGTAPPLCGSFATIHMRCIDVTMSLSKSRFVPPEKRNNASATHNMVRNLGGSSASPPRCWRRRADYRTRGRLCSGSGIGLRPRYKD